MKLFRDQKRFILLCTTLIIFGFACTTTEKDIGEDKASEASKTGKITDTCGVDLPSREKTASGSSPKRVQRTINPAFKVRFTDFCGYPNCKACHAVIAEEFEKQEPFHVNAFSLLEDEGEEDNPECLACHTTGYNDGGKYVMENEEEQEDFRFGYSIDADSEVQERFKGVTCEACHGPYCGTYTKVRDIKPRCMRCHDKDKIPHDASEFVWEKAHAKIKHSFIGKKRTDVKFVRFPEKYRVDTSEFIGLHACATCHVANYMAYEANQLAHSTAYDILPEESWEDPKCLRCHVTGYRDAGGNYPMETGKFRHNRKKGFSPANDEDENEKYIGVQCEACHGAHCGFTRDPKVIEARCKNCHDGSCEHDDGSFRWEKDYPEVRHEPQEPVDAESTITHEWWISWKNALAESRKSGKPILLFFLIPEL
ncbi:MAG: multiheme c-type cytochrome [Planctomycetota bacterium]